MAAAEWTQVWNAQVQAFQLEAAEQQYATCYTYADLDQDLADASPPAPVGTACSTVGLTHAEAQEIQTLVMQAV
jgi:hypothetical protein